MSRRRRNSSVAVQPPPKPVPAKREKLRTDVPPQWMIEALEKLDGGNPSRDSSLRRRACERLRDRAEDARPFYQFVAGTLAVTMLRDSVGAVRSVAAEALGALGAQAAPHAATLALVASSDTDQAVREAAIGALGSLGEAATPDAEVLITAALRDGDGSVRSAAIEALGKIGKTELLASALAGDSERVVRWRAAQALSTLGEAAAPHAATLAAAALDDSAAAVRKAAVGGLVAIGEAAAPCIEEFVLALQQEDDPSRRKKAARALGAMGHDVGSRQTNKAGTELAMKVMAPHAKALLDSALGDSNGFVRFRASEALGTMGEAAEEHASTLANLAVQDTDEVTRDRAAEALGALGDTCAAPHVAALAKSLEHEDPRVQRRAAEVLLDMDRAALPHLGALAATTLGDGGRAAEVRVAAANAFCVLGAPTACPGPAADTRRAAWPCAHDLGLSLRDGDGAVLRATARALGFLGDAASEHAGSLASLKEAALLRAETSSLQLEARCASKVGTSEEFAMLHACRSPSSRTDPFCRSPSSMRRASRPRSGARGFVVRSP
mmetsp:Transcript_8587/g.19104  ORF Transcript_8587/g.19104 Transcript_8587/m.19104 type:complete len:553 (+) Transcript_8587:121-1779(+)